ncbi:beta-1 3-galactosyltransferase 1 [Biomphalaria glabrata]|nr:beta-1; 3-galactosyltransferase 1-like [Biomphalaria glabrata]
MDEFDGDNECWKWFTLLRNSMNYKQNKFKEIVHRITIRNSFTIVLLVQLVILMTWGLYPVTKPKERTDALLYLSTDDPRLLLLNSLAERETGYDYINKHYENLRIVFQQMDSIIKEDKKSILSFIAQPIINNHSFSYLHNPDKTCVNATTEILIVVPSAPGNFENRLNIRYSDYINFTRNAENKARLLFFLGQTKSDEMQSKIDGESAAYEDIVQESFEDVYQNIRYKAVSMLKWANTFCPQAQYVIRSDDDVLVNLSAVTGSLKATHKNFSNFILGRVRFHDAPTRNKKEKYYLSEQEYPERWFPPFALGGLLGYPMLTVKLLYQAALREKPIWLDDVFITGICAPKVGVRLINESSFAFMHKGKWAH